MTKKSKQIDKQTSALKNEETNSNNIYPIDNEYNYEPNEDDIDEPDDYDFMFEESLLCEAEGIGEILCYLYYLADRYAKAEKNLRKMETIIVKSIGRDSYEDMLDLIHYHKESSERDIKETNEQYAVLHSHYHKCE